MIVNRILRLRIFSSIILLCCRPPLWWSKMAEHNWLLTLFFHFLFIFLSFLDNKIICILKLPFLMFPSLIESTISLHLFQFLNLLQYSLWILFQNPNLSYFLPFFFIPLELLLPLLLAEGVGGVHDLPSLGRLHPAPPTLLPFSPTGDVRRRAASGGGGGFSRGGRERRWGSGRSRTGV